MWNGYVSGRGDGTFGPFHEVEIHPPYLGENSSGPELADFDLDGHLDLAFGGWHSLDVVFGAGDGSVSRTLVGGGMYAQQALVADLDRDGAPDVVSAGYIIVVYHNETLVSGVPRFIRGDANGDGEINIPDPVFTLGHLFLGWGGPPCAHAADADDSGTLNLSDPIFTLNYCFLGGSAPRQPFPGCGADPAADDARRVERWRGGLGQGLSVSRPFRVAGAKEPQAMLRFNLPLIEPDVRN